MDKKYHSKGVGSQMMDFIKGWFTDGRNKTGCRFIVVDAYNEAAVLRYYSKNSFQFLMDEQKEKEEFNLPQSQLRTRIMYYNLLKLTT